MKNFMAKIWIPTLLVTFAALQAFGIDIKRAVSYHESEDTLAVASTTDSSMHLAQADSLILTDDSLVNRLVLSAKDTIKAPDSLKFIDPFFYKYYVAVKDSSTRAFVRDSMMTAGDTLGALRLDSLYLKDSTDMAIAKHNAWYASLSRRERKKYDAEQRLPLLIAESNRKIAIKDSIRAYKDSVIEI